MEDELWVLLASTVERSGLELLDVEVRPGLLRVVVDGPGGAQLDAIAEATRSVSAALDSHDPLPGQRYTLEVTSPGVERPLRAPRHFSRAVGETVSVRTVAGDAGARRVTGRLVSADEDGFVLEVEGEQQGRHFAYDEVERARTVFEWGSGQRPGGPGRPSPHGGRGGGTDRKRVTTP